MNIPPDEVFQNIGKRTRKNIRKGINTGKVRIEEIKEPSQVAICYDLLRKTYQLAKVPIADRSLFESAFEILQPKGMLRYVLAYVEEFPVATSVELIYKDLVFGWYSGLDRNYSRYTPNELLMRDILRWGSENNYRIYDFGGAGHPDQEYGVRDFKSKFGGSLVCYGRHTFIHAPVLLQLSTLGYNLLRGVISR